MKKILLYVLALVLSASCASVPILGPAFSTRVKVIEGEIIAIDRQESYEQPCHFVCRMLGGDPSQAYTAKVIDAEKHVTEFWFFAHDGAIVPRLGDHRAWKLTPATIIGPFEKCSQYGCPNEFGYQLLPNDFDWSPRK